MYFDLENLNLKLYLIGIVFKCWTEKKENINQNHKQRNKNLVWSNEPKLTHWSWKNSQNQQTSKYSNALLRLPLLDTTQTVPAIIFLFHVAYDVLLQLVSQWMISK